MTSSSMGTFPVTRSTGRRCGPDEWLAAVVPPVDEVLALLAGAGEGAWFHHQVAGAVAVRDSSLEHLAQ